MKPFQQRVIDEKKSLDEKIEALVAFMGTRGGIYESLPEDEKARLRTQLRLMSDYSHVLGLRIAAFT